MCARLRRSEESGAPRRLCGLLGLLPRPPCCGVCAGLFRPHATPVRRRSRGLVCDHTQRTAGAFYTAGLFQPLNLIGSRTKAKAAIVHPLSFESPPSVLQKSGLLGEDVLAEDSAGVAGVGHAALASSPPMRAEEMAYRPCDTRRCNRAWSGAQCRCRVKQHWVH